MMARLVIPTRVRIRGEWWPVVRGVDLEGPEFPEHTKDTTYHGIVKDGTIYLSAKIFGKRVERVTFLHELLHACSPPASDDTVMASEQEEAFCEDVDDPLLRVLEKLEWE